MARYDVTMNGVTFPIELKRKPGGKKAVPAFPLIEVIKIIRKHTDCSLKAGKDCMEEIKALLTKETD